MEGKNYEITILNVLRSNCLIERSSEEVARIYWRGFNLRAKIGDLCCVKVWIILEETRSNIWTLESFPPVTSHFPFGEI